MLAFRAERAKRSGLALRVRVLELALGDFLERHGQVVLRARLDERRREVVEGPLAELVVVVVDLSSPLGGDDDQRVARVDVVHELVDAWMNHGRPMVAAAANSRSTMPASSPAALSRRSLTTTWSNRFSCSSCSRASATRSPI